MRKILAKNNLLAESLLLTVLATLLPWLSVVEGGAPGWGGFSARLLPSQQHQQHPSMMTTRKSHAAASRGSAAKDQLSTRLVPIMEQDDDVDEDSAIYSLGLRGGQDDHGFVPNSKPRSTIDQTVRAALQIVTTTCRVALPPVVACVRAVTAFYAALPMDALLAQAGLVYCFAGGYFPTLFAALQAAQHCGWENAVHAVDDLVDEAVTAIRACDLPPPSEWGEEKQHDARERRTNARQLFTEKTMIILATIDPMKINQAVAALYTTWMGVSTVLEREFAKTIALSVTIGDYIRPLTNFLLAPPAYLCVPERFHKWVPVVLGWGCKAAAMSVAWRIQRVLTAYSSAVAGGLMFSRSLFRMLRKRRVRRLGRIPPADGSEKSPLDEILGLAVAAAGLYSQIGNGFSFTVPFPLSLVTWPFELAERWIQWAITEDVD